MSISPVYEYYADDLWRYMYSKSQGLKNGWKCNGIAFYANNENEFNNVPVYSHYAEDPWRFNYSTDPRVDGGWKVGGVEFYASSQPGIGLAPVYLYYAENPWRTRLSFDENLGKGWSKDRILFYALASNLNILCKDSIINYEKIDIPEPRQDFIGEQIIRNDSEASMNQKIAMSRTLSNTFEWSLAEKVAFGYEINMEVGIPELLSAKETLKFEAELSSNQKWSKTEELTYLVDTTVTVPPKTKVKVVGALNWLDKIRIPFKMKMRLEAGEGLNLSGQQIFDIFKYMNPYGVELVEFQANAVIVSIKGVFSGSYGMKTSVDLVPIE